MTAEGYQRISREQLKARLESTSPDNEHRSEGFALINVLDREAFLEEHIPGSINIAVREIDQAEQRFDASKEIIVYGASPECTASPKAARELARRGFERVYDYEGGMSDWRDAGYTVEAA